MSLCSFTICRCGFISSRSSARLCWSWVRPGCSCWVAGGHRCLVHSLFILCLPQRCSFVLVFGDSGAGDGAAAVDDSRNRQLRYCQAKKYRGPLFSFFYCLFLSRLFQSAVCRTESVRTERFALPAVAAVGRPLRPTHAALPAARGTHSST